MASLSESSIPDPRKQESPPVELVTPTGERYGLYPLGTNELCALEEERGKVFGALMVELGVLGMERANLSTIRAFIKRCLDRPMTDEQVGWLIDAVGFDGISAAINQLITPAQTPPPPKRRKARTH